MTKSLPFNVDGQNKFYKLDIFPIYNKNRYDISL